VVRDRYKFKKSSLESPELLKASTKGAQRPAGLAGPWELAARHPVGAPVPPAPQPCTLTGPHCWPALLATLFALSFQAKLQPGGSSSAGAGGAGGKRRCCCGAGPAAGEAAKTQQRAAHRMNGRPVRCYCLVLAARARLA